jgi:hypothetical protein
MGFQKLLTFCLFGAILLVSCHATTRIELERSILDQVLSGYNKDLRPPGDNATLVTVNAYIRSIPDICEKSHQWKVQLTFRQQWNDPRLAYSVESYPNYHHLTLSTKKDLWTPDLFFSGELDAHFHDVPQGNTLLRIEPNGDVLYSIRITLTLPWGTGGQPGEVTLPLAVASYAHVTDEIVLKWKEEKPIQINDKIVLDDYTIDEPTTGSSESVTNTGTYSKLLAKLHLHRKRCAA